MQHTMTHDDPTLQAAIDAAFLANGDARGGSLATNPAEYPGCWANEARARLDVAKQFLAALPPADAPDQAEEIERLREELGKMALEYDQCRKERAALASLPSLSRLRPLAEAGPVPEGAVRVRGFQRESLWMLGVMPCEQDTHCADFLPPAAPASEASQEVKPKHQKSYIVCARLDCPQTITHYEASCPTCTARQEAETFVTRGKTWIRHKPGDPMPCDENAQIEILMRSGGKGNSSTYGHWGEIEQASIIGWRYADQRAPEPVIRTFKDAIRATPETWRPAVGDVVRLKSGGPEMTVIQAGDECVVAWADGNKINTLQAAVACLEPAGKEESKP